MAETTPTGADGAGQSLCFRSLFLGVGSNRNNLPQVPCLPRSGFCA
jgi:hypothetical protein